jgi:glycerophosphoryl diester phosphodiesterase
MRSKHFVIAHRGFSGRWPENTLASVRAALRLGVDFVEVDVHETHDGQLVVFHDDDLRRRWGHPDRVRDLTLTRLRRLAPDIPTLRSVLRACRGRARVLVEIKRATPVKVATEIRLCRMARRVIVFTFHNRLLAEFAAIAPDIPRFALVAGRLPFRQKTSVAGIGASRRLIRSARTVAAIHRRGWKLFVWTVNRPADMARLYRWGVDGVITNHPDRAKLVLRQPPRRLSSANP